jgi:hypothetical protein
MAAQEQGMRWRAGTGTALSMLMLAGAASVETAPRLTPAKDVDITYRVSRPGEPVFSRRVRWQAGAGLERVDGPGNAIVIVDHRTHYETLLRRETRTYLKIAVPPGSDLDPNPNIPRNRAGQTRVAGLPCTEWEWTDPEDSEPHSLCVTDDGVLLRAKVNGQTVLLARSVRYRKPKPGIFTPPDNYEPALAPGGPVD